MRRPAEVPGTAKSDGKVFVVDVTFYPKTKLWIEDPHRRQITTEELERDYARLQI